MLEELENPIKIDSVPKAVNSNPPETIESDSLTNGSGKVVRLNAFLTIVPPRKTMSPNR
jgi:hypothetical protein